MSKKINQKRITLISLLAIFCLGLSSNVQAQQAVDMADTMRSNGKIYVVVAVCLTIVLGLFVYVFMLDKKISSLEKNNADSLK